MSARKINTTEMFNRKGGEIADPTGNGYETRNVPSDYVPPDKGSNLTGVTRNNNDSIDSYRFDAVVAFFERKGVPETLARTYGAALMDAAISTGRDVTELVDFNQKDEIILSNEALQHINFYRPKTSQIGYNRNKRQIPPTIKRTIFP